MSANTYDFGTWFAAMAINRVAAFYANKWATRRWKGRSPPPLPDVALDRLPHLPYWVPEAFLLVAVLNCALFGNMTVFFQVARPAMLMRALLILVTLYPTPVLNTFVGYGTYDLMFSGHTTLLLAASNTPGEYAWALAGMLSILASRQHYTSDVLVAAFIVELLKKNIANERSRVIN